jgi:hypothetical protein
MVNALLCFDESLDPVHNPIGESRTRKGSIVVAECRPNSGRLFRRAASVDAV